MQPIRKKDETADIGLFNATKTNGDVHVFNVDGPTTSRTQIQPSRTIFLIRDGHETATPTPRIAFMVSTDWLARSGYYKRSRTTRDPPGGTAGGLNRGSGRRQHVACARANLIKHCERAGQPHVMMAVPSIMCGVVACEAEIRCRRLYNKVTLS